VNCYVHDRTAAVGICALCQRAVCRECVGSESPRIVCSTCVQRRPVLGYEYRSKATIAGWPLVHVCMGADPVTMRPRVAKGVIAIGNIAVGGVAIAGLACGLVTLGGLSLGLLLALGGAAIGVGWSLGGLAVGAVAFGGLAVGYVVAIGGAAFGPAIIDGRVCDPAALDFVLRWFDRNVLPPSCQ
jgi:hypothetical protein